MKNGVAEMWVGRGGGIGFGGLVKGEVGLLVMQAGMYWARRVVVDGGMAGEMEWE